jgi:hypothetical protein
LAGSVDDDHVPPKLFYPRSIRRAANLDDLLTLPTHRECNSAYRLDEEYFVYSLGPLAGESFAGGTLVRDIGKRYADGKSRPLAQMILGEFDPRPSGLYLPEGAVLKRVDGPRAARVLWKLTRGLYAHRKGAILSADHPYHLDIIEPGASVPDVYRPVIDSPSLGQYPGVFDYKNREYEGKTARLDVWAMLLWDRIIAVTVVPAGAPAESPGSTGPLLSGP